MSLDHFRSTASDTSGIRLRLEIVHRKCIELHIRSFAARRRPNWMGMIVDRLDIRDLGGDARIHLWIAAAACQQQQGRDGEL